MSWQIRLETQPEAFVALLSQVDPTAERAAPGRWSARENLAHLGRHAEVFHERVVRILREERPPLERYRAEEDPAWPAWQALSWAEALGRWQTVRAALVDEVRALSAAELARTGRHPAFGEMSLRQWLEFFLLHEAHHLYAAISRLGEASR